MSNFNKYNNIEVAIIGAGPSGLATASHLISQGISFWIIEKGVHYEERNKSNPENIISGVGGAGLFSDGKLSYFPSATALWSLPQEAYLREAYAWFHNLISDYSESFPNYPDITSFDTLFKEEFLNHSSDILTKKYYSYLLTPEQQLELTKRLVYPIRHRIISKWRVCSIQKQEKYYLLRLKSEVSNEIKELIAKYVIFCGGRFGPLQLTKIAPNLPLVFRRFEYGVRLEQKYTNFFLKNWPTHDAKIIFYSDTKGIEFRTFCKCHNGKVIISKFDNMLSCSGSSNCDTSYSNIGFNVRIRSIKIFESLRNEINDIFVNQRSFKINLTDFLQSKEIFFGKRLDQFLKEGLNKLIEKYQITDCCLYGPAIEGVGYYPWLSSNLETRWPGLFIAGDSTGLFRGLLSSFISGFYVAKNIIINNASNLKTLKTNVLVKKSSVSNLQTIFTAQSKKFFYCRDAVCEYVFKKGMIPLNPFRIFDYFLSDRVERDIIRRSNNHLVKTCDELWVFGPISDGVLFEIIYAINLKKPIRFLTIDTYAKNIKPIDDIMRITFEPEVHCSRQKREVLLDEIKDIFYNYNNPKQLRLWP